MNNEISVSFVVSRDKYSINNVAKLKRVANHNLRKYNNHMGDYNGSKNVLFVGTNDMIGDVKKAYNEVFGDALKEYNQKQIDKGQLSRQIDDYFMHINNSETLNLCEEIILQVGDKEFYENNNVSREEKIQALNKLYETFTKQFPTFKVCNAVMHLDEASPHIQLVGFPYTTGNKKGLSTSISKNKVFNKRTLEDCWNSLFQLQFTLGNQIYKATNQYSEVRGNLTIEEYKEMKELEKQKKAIAKSNSKVSLPDLKDNITRELVNILDEHDIKGRDMEPKKFERAMSLNSAIEIIDEYQDKIKSGEVSQTTDNKFSIDCYERKLETKPLANEKYIYNEIHNAFKNGKYKKITTWDNLIHAIDNQYVFKNASKNMIILDFDKQPMTCLAKLDRLLKTNNTSHIKYPTYSAPKVYEESNHKLCCFRYLIIADEELTKEELYGYAKYIETECKGDNNETLLVDRCFFDYRDRIMFAKSKGYKVNEYNSKVLNIKNKIIEKCKPYIDTYKQNRKDPRYYTNLSVKPEKKDGKFIITPQFLKYLDVMYNHDKRLVNKAVKDFYTRSDVHFSYDSAIRLVFANFYDRDTQQKILERSSEDTQDAIINWWNNENKDVPNNEYFKKLEYIDDDNIFTRIYKYNQKLYRKERALANAGKVSSSSSVSVRETPAKKDKGMSR